MFRRRHRVKLVVDEWCAWYKPGSEVHPTHLPGQQSTIRDAVPTVTNPDPNAARETEIAVHGATIKEAQVTTLAAKDIHAHHSFDNPRAIEPQPAQATVKGWMLVDSFAPRISDEIATGFGLIETRLSFFTYSN